MAKVSRALWLIDFDEPNRSSGCDSMLRFRFRTRMKGLQGVSVVPIDPVNFSGSRPWSRLKRLMVSDNT